MFLFLWRLMFGNGACIACHIIIVSALANPHPFDFVVTHKFYDGPPRSSCPYTFFKEGSTRKASGSQNSTLNRSPARLSSHDTQSERLLSLPCYPAAGIHMPNILREDIGFTHCPSSRLSFHVVRVQEAVTAFIVFHSQNVHIVGLLLTARGSVQGKKWATSLRCSLSTHTFLSRWLIQ